MLRFPGGRDRLDQALVEELPTPGFDGCDDARQLALSDVGDVGNVALRLLLTVVALEPVEMTGEGIEGVGRARTCISWSS